MLLTTRLQAALSTSVLVLEAANAVRCYLCIVEPILGKDFENTSKSGIGNMCLGHCKRSQGGSVDNTS